MTKKYIEQNLYTGLKLEIHLHLFEIPKYEYSDKLYSEPMQ